MAGFGLGSIAGHCLFGGAAPANFVGMGVGLVLVLYLQRRSGRERRHR